MKPYIIFTIVMASLLLGCSKSYIKRSINKKNDTNKQCDTCYQYFTFFKQYWKYDSLDNVYYVQDTFLLSQEGLYQSFDSMFYRRSNCWKGKKTTDIVNILGKPCNKNAAGDRIEYSFYLNPNYIPRNFRSYNGSYSSKRLIIVETDNISPINQIEMAANKGDIGFLMINLEYKKKK